ncbi:diacylglycerol kinase family protein [Evansella sp. AB-rgal1]|uniref:diacylglycerol/lipid kinase family protein n=1 Tax=Evansella sp. AB-rgal1 TaxID=3242696 RepID=UPI00359E4ECF
MYIIIANINSGRRQTNNIMKQLHKIMDTTFVTYFTNNYQDKVSMWEKIDSTIKECKHQLLGFIIIGGDGTIHHVLQHLQKYDFPFGIIKAGSGNDFSRALQIPKNTKKAIERIKNNNPKWYDYIKVEDRIALSVVGIGVDAETALKCQDSKIKNVLNRAFLGRLTYLAVFLQTIVHYHPFHVLVQDEFGKEHSFDRVWLLAAGNTPYYGGGIPICPEANPHDGEISLVVIHNISLFQLILALPTVFIKKHISLPYVAMLNGKQFSIITSKNQAVQGDGEEISSTPVTIRIIENGARFF